MFDVSEIAGADAAKIIATQEGHFADVKDIRIKPATLTRTVSAFANASGGEILLGISEDVGNGDLKHPSARDSDISLVPRGHGA